MRVPEGPAPRQSPHPTSPIIPANPPPSSSIAEPPSSPMQEDLVSPNPPKKNSTPQRTRRQETPPPATTTRLHSHITPTKRADPMMLRSKEMRLALLPSAQDPPPPPVEPFMHTSIQPDGVPPTPRVIPPTPSQHTGDFARHEVNYAESRRGRYPSPGNSRQSPVYPEGHPSYDMMMMPPPVDHRDDYTEVYENPSDNSYHRSPAGSRETSMQPLYQHTGGYPNLHRPPHTRLSPRTDYSNLPGQPRRPSHYPNPYTYHERSAQPSERASYNLSVGTGSAQRSQSPASNDYNVPPSDVANQIPSRSPRPVYSNIPVLVEGDERQARMPSQSPRTAYSNISGLVGGDERHARSPLAPNCKTPEPAGAVNIPSTRPHPPTPATSTKVPEPGEVLGELSEHHAPVPMVVKPARGPEEPTQLSSIPPVSAQVASTSTSSTPVVAVNTSQPSTPTSSSAPKKPGRPSNKSLGLIASTFAEIDETINGLASMTGMTRMQLVARWLADAKGPGSHTTWNTYLKYFAANKETEAARVSSDSSTVHSTAFRAQCYAKYQEEVSDWLERLTLFEELEMFSSKGMTVGQRSRAFRQFEAKLKKITNAAHTEFNFETAYVTGGSIVHADQGLTASHETIDAKNFWAECCRAPNKLEQDHFKAHIGKQVSNHIIDEKWGDSIPPSVKAETEADGDFIVIRQLWTAIIRVCDDTWPDTQFIWKGHLKRLAEAGLVTYNYPNHTMTPGERKPGNLRAKGIADMWKSEQNNMLAALGAPGVAPAKHLMRVEKVANSDKQKLLDGLLPVLICAPPESPSEEPRKIYYHADGADDNTKPAEVSDNRRTTRSAGAASSTSSKAPAKKSSSTQPQKRPEIHLFSSKSRIAEDSDNEIIELPSPDHGAKSRGKKRALPDGDEVVEVEKTHSKQASLRPLYDSDSDEKTAAKKVKKSVTKKAEASTVRVVKTNDKGAVRGRRGGRAGGCGGKPRRAVKSKVIITDSSSADSDLEVPASDPVEAPLTSRPRPKPKPAYKTASSVITETVEIPTSAATALQPPTDISTESSLTTASETSTYLTPLVSQQVPILQGTDDIISATSTYQQQGPLENPIPSATSLQVASSGPPQTLTVTPAASASNPIPSVTGTQVANLGLPQTLTVAAAPFAPSVPLQGDFFEGGLIPAGEGPQAHTTWDPRLPYTDSTMQHHSRGYTGYRDPRLDHAGREPFRSHSRPPSEDGWGIASRHDNYRNQDRRRGYEEVMWDGSRRDEYREVRRGGRDEARWDPAGQEEYREVRQMGRDEGWAVGGRYDVRRLPEARQMGWEAPREELARYGATYGTADYGDPSHYGQGPAMRLPNSTYPGDAPFDNGHDYLHPPPPPPPSHSSNTSTSPFRFQAELQQMIPNTLAAPSTTDNTI